MYAFIYILWYIHMWLCVYHLRTEKYVQENMYYAQRNMSREELAKKKKKKKLFWHNSAESMNL